MNEHSYPHYGMQIAWSEEDQAYLVTLPEWRDLTDQPCAHGATYEEAARRGRDAVESLVDLWREDGKPLPAPALLAPEAVAT